MSTRRWYEVETLNVTPTVNEYGITCRSICQDPNGYYFCDETESAVFGPFNTLHEARFELNRYVEWLNRKWWQP